MNVIRMCLKAGAILALATVANGADWYVSADMGYGADVADAAHRKNNLQSAINSATPGDTIWVADGFVCDSGSADVSGSAYRITTSKALTIRAENGDWRTGPTIRGSQDATTPVGCFAKTAVNAKVQIIGFNFADGKTGGDGGGVRGNGYNGGWNLTLRNCRAYGCAAAQGGGATLVDAYDCVFSGNSAVASGAGAYNCRLFGCALDGNVQSGSTSSAAGGGGLHTGMASNCVFTGNSGYIGGAAKGVTTMRKCRLEGNSAVSNGGGAADGGTVWDTVFIANRAGSRGGGMFGGSTISNCVFASNTALGYGGGLALQGVSAEIRDYAFTNNVTKETGGGISCSVVGTVLYECLVADNVATNNGGGILRAELHDCIVSGNKSVNGYGGGMSLGTAYRSSFTRNEALSGGGVCGVKMADCDVTDNMAVSRGGGILGSDKEDSYITAESLFVTNCVIAGNSVTSASKDNGGGGAYGATLVRCVVSNNLSRCWCGGGVYRCNTINSLIVGNTCAFEWNNNNRGGGGIYAGTHYNALIAGNTSWGGGGGALSARLVNCTVVANTNASTRATLAGGCGNCNLINTVSWGNVGGNDDGFKNHVATNSISTVSLASYGPGNSTANPRLAAESRGPYVPAFGSPCRNAGLVQDWMCDPTDVRSKSLGGRARIVGPAPDIGAYEAGFDATRVLVR